MFDLIEQTRAEMASIIQLFIPRDTARIVISYLDLTNRCESNVAKHEDIDTFNLLIKRYRIAVWETRTLSRRDIKYIHAFGFDIFHINWAYFFDNKLHSSDAGVAMHGIDCEMCAHFGKLHSPEHNGVRLPAFKDVLRCIYMNNGRLEAFDRPYSVTINSGQERDWQPLSRYGQMPVEIKRNHHTHVS